MKSFKDIIHFIEAVKARLVSIIAQVKLYHPMREALVLLSKKNVPVFFYERVGLLKGYNYPEETKIRTLNKLSFPKMYQHINQYEHELARIFGEKYSKEYVENLGKIPQVVKKGDYYCHEDFSSRYINVVNGQRQTCYQPNCFVRTIHIYGRCGVFGYAVEDCDTMPSQVQKYLIEKGITDIRVVNHGLWGGEDNLIEHNFLEDVLGFGPNDIVIFYMRHFQKPIMKGLLKCGVWYKNFTKEWHESAEALTGFYDRPGHMNDKGYKDVAKLLSDDLISHNFKAKAVNLNETDNLNVPHLTAYLKKHRNNDLVKEIKHFTDTILEQNPPQKDKNNCGAIVMNCNPFTKGHRFLIDYAAAKVDRLYIFVVEENKSIFNFEDRFEMVKKGTADITNVVVVPSGKYVISAYTFPEYFMKDYVKEKNFDVSMDIEIFCKYIAPALSIKIRFAGEEPLDPVTANYNKTMKEILPKYSMKFCEISRVKTEDGTVINATEVRNLLVEKQYDKLHKLVPDTTFDILMRNYKA